MKKKYLNEAVQDKLAALMGITYNSSRRSERAKNANNANKCYVSIRPVRLCAANAQRCYCFCYKKLFQLTVFILILILFSIFWRIFNLRHDLLLQRREYPRCMGNVKSLFYSVLLLKVSRGSFAFFASNADESLM